MGVMVQSAVNARLKDKVTRLSTLPTQSKSASIPALRDSQIYDNIAATTSSSGEGLQETRLKQDVYYLENHAAKRKR